MHYPLEVLDADDDNGTMPANVQELAGTVVGHRIVTVSRYGTTRGKKTIITLDNGHQVELADSNDCCAYTLVENFLLHTKRVDHVITGVGTTDSYTKWHIYADAGDVLELSVGWSPGNPFYYGYGFDIAVRPIADAAH